MKTNSRLQRLQRRRRFLISERDFLLRNLNQDIERNTSEIHRIKDKPHASKLVWVLQDELKALRRRKLDLLQPID